MRPQKKERRLYYRQLQDSFPAAQYEIWNQQLAPRLCEAAKALPKNSFVAVYQARAKEANLTALFSLPLRFCFPRVLSSDGQMEFRWVKNPSIPEEFLAGAYGILEPRDHHPLVEKEKMSASFVPLLSFDNDGRRLGQGKGYYDRFLEGFSGQIIGVGFEWQHAPQPLPIENHDQRLHIVVTEQAIRAF